MIIKLLFICCLVAILIYTARITRTKGFEKLKISRNIENNRIFVGEEFTIETVVENNKWLPISFILIKEKMPLCFNYIDDEQTYKNNKVLYHISRYVILSYERRKRKYKVKALKRGVYIIKDIKVTIGDLFGFSAETREFLDYKEFIVYPKVKKISQYKFNTTSFLGYNVIKRWIYKDPLYIKGIREYTREDRMKDIHWKSSLKMSKLMVKEYDYTSERELVIILNVQCGEIQWQVIDENSIENAIKIGASLASKAIKEGVPTGMWTNAKLVSIQSKCSREIKPSNNSLMKIMDLCARVDYTNEMKFDEYLQNKKYDFKNRSTYVIVTPFLNNNCIKTISKLTNNGIDIKLIDVSSKLNIPEIRGVENIKYKGEVI